jgi:hypothetical protein
MPWVATADVCEGTDSCDLRTNDRKWPVVFARRQARSGRTSRVQLLWRAAGNGGAKSRSAQRSPVHCRPRCQGIARYFKFGMAKQELNSPKVRKRPSEAVLDANRNLEGEQAELGSV